MNVSDTYLYDNRTWSSSASTTSTRATASSGCTTTPPARRSRRSSRTSEVVQYGDTKTWKTHTFALTDAVMTNRSNGSDFRIHTGDGSVELKVAAVRVAKVATTLDVTEGLVDLIDEAARVQKAAREGTRDGQYPAGSRATLLAAIDDARAVAATPGVTDVQVKAALHDPADQARRVQRIRCRHQLRTGRYGDRQQRHRQPPRRTTATTGPPGPAARVTRGCRSTSASRDRSTTYGWSGRRRTPPTTPSRSRTTAPPSPRSAGPERPAPTSSARPASRRDHGPLRPGAR